MNSFTPNHNKSNNFKKLTSNWPATPSCSAKKISNSHKITCVSTKTFFTYATKSKKWWAKTSNLIFTQSPTPTFHPLYPRKSTSTTSILRVMSPTNNIFNDLLALPIKGNSMKLPPFRPGIPMSLQTLMKRQVPSLKSAWHHWPIAWNCFDPPKTKNKPSSKSSIFCEPNSNPLPSLSNFSRWLLKSTSIPNTSNESILNFWKKQPPHKPKSKTIDNSSKTNKSTNILPKSNANKHTFHVCTSHWKGPKNFSLKHKPQTWNSSEKSPILNTKITNSKINSKNASTKKPKIWSFNSQPNWKEKKPKIERISRPSNSWKKTSENANGNSSEKTNASNTLDWSYRSAISIMAAIPNYLHPTQAASFTRHLGKNESDQK